MVKPKEELQVRSYSFSPLIDITTVTEDAFTWAEREMKKYGRFHRSESYGNVTILHYEVFDVYDPIDIKNYLLTYNEPIGFELDI